jgi:hypothetical protein
MLMKPRSFLVCVAVVFFLLVVNVQTFAQRASGSISGLATETTGAVIPDAKVDVTSLTTGTVRQTQTNSDGLYSITGLLAGTYSVSVRHEGFSTFRVPSFVLQVDDQATVNAKLSVGQVSLVVDVTESVNQVDTQSSTVNTVVDSKMMNDLPLNGRNALQLTVLTPGVVEATNGSPFIQGHTRPEAAAGVVSSSGGRGNSTAYG